MQCDSSLSHFVVDLFNVFLPEVSLVNLHRSFDFVSQLPRPVANYAVHYYTPMVRKNSSVTRKNATNEARCVVEVDALVECLLS